MSDGTSFDDTRPYEQRSTLRLIERAARNGWEVPENIRKAAIAVATNVLADPKAKASARMRAVEAIMAMERDDLDRTMQLVDREASLELLRMQGQRKTDRRTEVEEILTLRIERLRKERPDAADTIETIVDAGLRRLGLPTREAAGDGAGATGQGA